MKRYRDKHAECEAWYKQIKMWDAHINAFIEQVDCTLDDDGPSIRQIKQSQTDFDKNYVQLFWAYNKNPRPSGRKRLSSGELK